MIIALQTLIFFRESVLSVLDRWLPPLFRQLFLKFSRSGLMIEDDESEDQVFADYDDERGVVFFPPVYAQRYAAVCDCLMDEQWYGKLDKVVNMGKHHDMAFIKYLTEVPGITEILGLDIECSLQCSSDLLDFTFDNYRRKREKPLLVTLLRGNAADPDYRLIGCDAVIAIEMIENLLPHDLDRLVHNVFGFIKPWIAIFTTPNADFNVLLKSLEKTGLRRVDHYFEWTREQLHDWCSNIVARYPNYTVSCRGVGPGPVGTSHYGCYSQLVMFMSKNYQKQMELNVNSLALVANLPQPNQISDFISGWESPTVAPGRSHMLCGPTDVESSFELQYPGYCSCHSTLTPSYSETAVLYQDKASQCNLESELGKSFVMFNVEEMYEVVMPRRRVYSRIYEIEDVASRLNNTMFEVKKFSKTTQNLMAKNKMDSLVHTREVMDEISHLTKMLNFNCLTQGEESYTWCNINWGENAPYWNQYYKVMAVYNYPCETKDEDSVILDLISDEINKLLDTEYNDGVSIHVSKLEIPLDMLMDAVKHITDDVDRVIDLMEYNGYEVDGNVVIHSRMVVDEESITSRDDDWIEEAYSDWDTIDNHSTSVSDGSNVALDFHARCLRRALDRKVRKLRTMFTHDEDITRELNHVVCRLLKIALTSSRGRQVPVQSKWLQCKLLDLLTLTEKAILRRKLRFIERYPLKALNYESQEAASEMMELCRIKEDDTALRIVEKYRHLVQDNNIDINKYYNDIDLEDDLTTPSDGYIQIIDCIDETNTSGFELINLSLHKPEHPSMPERDDFVTGRVINRTQNWVNEDLSLIPYAEDINECMISSGDDRSSSKGRSTRLKPRKKHNLKTSNRGALKNRNLGSRERSLSNASHNNKTEIRSNRDVNYKVKNSRTGPVGKKVMKTKSSYKNLVRKLSHKATGIESKIKSDFDCKPNFVLKPNEGLKDHTIVQLTEPKPIPDNIIELCHPELCAQKHFQELNYASDGDAMVELPMSATMNSVLIEIVTDEKQEIIAMRRTVGTDVEVDPEMYEQELELKNVTNVINDDVTDAFYGTLPLATENVHSQTIFLYDINEPSTSKGVRHVSMDVQCGTDATVSNYAMLSVTTSLTTLPKMYATGIKIGDSYPDVRADKTSEFGTCTNETNISSATMSPRIKSVGIIIKDSQTSLIRNSVTDVRADEKSNLEPLAKAIYDNHVEESLGLSGENKSIDFDAKDDEIKRIYTTEIKKNCIDELNKASATTTEMLKQVSSYMKIEDSCSEFNGSFGSLSKAPLTVRFAEESNTSRVAMPRFPMSKYMRPKLSCGGVHVHSYMDRQVSEDVVYQGEWQQYRPKTMIRKKPYNYITFRKNKESILKKTTPTPKNNVKIKPDKKIASKKTEIAPTQVRHDTMKEEGAKKLTRSAIKVTRPVFKSAKNITKVASKLTIGNIPQKKNSKTMVHIVRKTKSVLPAVAQDGEKPKKKLRNNYIPSYLSKMPKRAQQAQSTLKTHLNAKTGTLLNTIKVNQVKQSPKEPIPLQSNAEEIKTELLKVYIEPRENISYIVFRNEIENSKSSTALGETTVSARPSDRGSSINRTLSPVSQNSSSCSSPNSVSTVRAVPTWPKPLSSKRHSTPNKSNVSRNGSESKMSSKNKKFTKKTITSKRESDKDVDNKENVPESSNNLKLVTKDTDRVVSGGIIGTRDNIITAQFLSDNTQTPNRSSMKIPFVKSTDGKNRPSMSMSNESKDYTKKNSNMVVLIEPGQPESNTQVTLDSPSSQESLKIIDNKVLSEWIASPNKNIVESHTSNILAAMKQLVEESLDFIDTSDNFRNIDSKTIVLSREGSNNTSLNEMSMSPSIQTKPFIDGSDTLNSLSDNKEPIADYESIPNIARSMMSVEDPDLLSFKSVQSSSKLSDCFADNESCDFNSPPINSCAVRDIFERKETVLTQNPGALAIQAFSGYSMNADPAGDQPDFVNLIDSETGSRAYEIPRLATSEELFVSGRSSESFASCLPEDDSVVPNWLFQIISQQQSGSLNRSLPRENLGAEQEIPLPFPIDLDENSNESGLAVGAGAGDGRGMHSDQSQDSSGRGSSLSSSATSSGAQSEAIIIDPTAFIAQFEMLREPANASATPAPDDSTDSSARTTFDPQSTTRSTVGGHAARPLVRALRAASDVEADISSIDTDVPSDN